jgi:hypothetical protein
MKRIVFLSFLFLAACGLPPEVSQSVPPADFPPYPQWPPEDASWQIRLDEELSSDRRAGMSLLDVGDALLGAIENATYQPKFYWAPGGFVMVIRLEAIEDDGTPLMDEQRRFRLPEDEVRLSLAEYVRSLFFAPEGYYRFIAFVVSDQFEKTSGEALSEPIAVERMTGGNIRLPDEYADWEFSIDHTIDALIYEFEVKGRDVETLVPGRLVPPQTHLMNSGLPVVLGNN